MPLGQEFGENVMLIALINFLAHVFRYYISRESYTTRNLYCHARLCMCVCLSGATFPHYTARTRM